MDESTHLEETDHVEIDEGALLEADMAQCFYAPDDTLNPMLVEILICMTCGHAVEECACEECVCGHWDFCGVCM